MTTATRVPDAAPRPARSHGARAVERWLLGGAYAAVVLVPLALMTGVMKAGVHGRAVVFADALGFAALSLLALQILVSGRWAATTRSFGLRPVLSLHRQAGVAVLVLVVAHIAILLVDDPAASRCSTRAPHPAAREPACSPWSASRPWPAARSGAGGSG